MTNERERPRPDREEDQPEDPLEREDVQDALAVEGDLPEGGRSGMEQASPNRGSKTVPNDPISGEGGEETSPHDDDGRGDIDGGEPRI